MKTLQKKALSFYQNHKRALETSVLITEDNKDLMLWRTEIFHKKDEWHRPNNLREFPFLQGEITIHLQKGNPNPTKLKMVDCLSIYTYRPFGWWGKNYFKQFYFIYIASKSSYLNTVDYFFQISWDVLFVIWLLSSLFLFYKTLVMVL